MSTFDAPFADDEGGVAIEDRKSPGGHAPRYNVVLWDDDHHTITYVMKMLQEIVKIPEKRAFELAEEVHDSGRAIIFTGVREPAEMKQEQVHAYGKDFSIKDCQGSMTATLEKC